MIYIYIYDIMNNVYIYTHMIYIYDIISNNIYNIQCNTHIQKFNI